MINKKQPYAEAVTHIESLIAGETDLIAVMSTIVCELHTCLDHFDWTGFYRVVPGRLLKVGPYQGGHGCLVIPFDRGVCGQCVRERRTQLVPDVTKLAHHIACSATTRSEIVIPVFDSFGEVRAVLDVDSDTLQAFDQLDAFELERICSRLTPLYQERFSLIN